MLDLVRDLGPREIRERPMAIIVSDLWFRVGIASFGQ